MEFTDEELESCINRVISDGNVTILDKPIRHNLTDEFRCLANVNGMLCVIVVNIYRLEDKPSKDGSIIARLHARKNEGK